MKKYQTLEEKMQELYDKPLALLTVGEFMELLEQRIQPTIIEKKDSPEMDEYLSTEEASKYLHVSSRTMQLYRDRRYINFSQFGRKISYLKSDLDQFMQNHKIYHRR